MGGRAGCPDRVGDGERDSDGNVDLNAAVAESSLSAESTVIVVFLRPGESERGAVALLLDLMRNVSC